MTKTVLTESERWTLLNALHAYGEAVRKDAAEAQDGRLREQFIVTARKTEVLTALVEQADSIELGGLDA
jgi:hypothetical protein